MPLYHFFFFLTFFIEGMAREKVGVSNELTSRHSIPLYTALIWRRKVKYVNQPYSALLVIGQFEATSKLLRFYLTLTRTTTPSLLIPD